MATCPIGAKGPDESYTFCSLKIRFRGDNFGSRMHCVSVEAC